MYSRSSHQWARFGLDETRKDGRGCFGDSAITSAITVYPSEGAGCQCCEKRYCRDLRPEQLRWFDAYNRSPTGEEKPYPERVKPFNFLGHAMPKPWTALPKGVGHDRFCLVAPAGERRHFVNRHDPKGAVYTPSVDFTPKTYADLIAAYDWHPERKFAGPDGRSCQEQTRGLLHDLPLVVGSIRHVGKEGNELEAHRAGLVTETERQLKYHDSSFEALVMALQQIPTKAIAEATGYNSRTVRRLKRGDFRPSNGRLSKLMKIDTTRISG